MIRSPFFSIVTACRNSEKTIRRTFDSVLAQSCKDYEYIIVDGASTDSTLDIIKEYEPKFEGRMRWISEPDKGIYDAMNKGIKMASGELIGIINSDDWYDPDALAQVRDCSDKNPAASVYYGITQHINSGQEKMLLRNHHSKLAAYTICHQSCFIAKKTHDEYGAYDVSYRICADYDFLLRVYLNNGVFQPVNHIIAAFVEGGACYVHQDIAEDENERIRLRYGIISRSQFIHRIIKRRCKETLRLLKILP